MNMEKKVTLTFSVRESLADAFEAKMREVEEVISRGAALEYEDRVKEAEEVLHGEYYFCATCGKLKRKASRRALYCSRNCQQKARAERKKES